MNKFTKIALITSLVVALLGIILIISGISMGARFIKYSKNYENLETENISQTFDAPIENLSINIKAGSLEIISGESFSIDASNIPVNSFSHSLGNGTLTIEADFPGLEDLRPDSFFYTIFNWAELGWNKGRNHDYAHTTITIPQNTSLDSVIIKVGAADLRINRLECDILDIDIAAARFRGSDIYANNSRIKTAAGDVTLSGVYLNNLNAVTETGSFKLSGAIPGDSTIITRVGSCRVEIWGSIADYNLSLKNSMGSLKVDNKDINTSNQLPVEFGLGSNNLKIETEVGSTEINFKSAPFCGIPNQE